MVRGVERRQVVCCGRCGGTVGPYLLFQSPACAAVGRALAPPAERPRSDVGEDPADEVTALGLFHDDLVVDLAGVHVDEMAVGGAVEGEAPQLQARVPDPDAQAAFLVGWPRGASECVAAGYLPHVDNSASVQGVAKLPCPGSAG